MGNFISPLRRAVRANRPDRVREVLEGAGRGGASADLINEDYTADCFLAVCQRNPNHVLHTAISYQRWPIVDLLLEYGADPLAPGFLHETALHKAARGNNLDLAKKLVYYGADLYIQDDHGSYPIHRAALSMIAGYWEKCEVLQYLVEEVGKAEDVNLEDDAKNTPLHCAAMRGNHQACHYLLSKGANPNAKNLKGQSAADVAANDKVKSMIRDATENTE